MFSSFARPRQMGFQSRINSSNLIEINSVIANALVESLMTSGTYPLETALEELEDNLKEHLGYVEAKNVPRTYYL